MGDDGKNGCSRHPLVLYWKSAWASAASEVTSTAAVGNPTAADFGTVVVGAGVVTVVDESALELFDALTSAEVEPVDKESFTESVSDAPPALATPPVEDGDSVAVDVPDALAGFGVVLVLVPGVVVIEAGDREAVLAGADVPGADVTGADAGFGVEVGEGVPVLGAGVVVIGDVQVIAWPVHVWLLLAHVSVGRLATQSIQQRSAKPAWSAHVHLAVQSEASVALWP